MKKLAILALAVLACGAPVLATPPTLSTETAQEAPGAIFTSEATYYVVLGETVNLRSGPGTAYPVIDIARQGDRLEAVCDGNWCRVLTKRGAVYIYAPCLTGQGICR